MGLWLALWNFYLYKFEGDSDHQAQPLLSARIPVFLTDGCSIFALRYSDLSEGKTERSFTGSALKLLLLLRYFSSHSSRISSLVIEFIFPHLILWNNSKQILSFCLTSFSYWKSAVSSLLPPRDCVSWKRCCQTSYDCQIP